MALRRSGVRIPSAPFTPVHRPLKALLGNTRLAVAVSLLAACSSVAAAQANERSRLIVLVQPAGSTAAVVMTYPDVVPHQSAKSRLLRLAELTGATVASVQINDTTVSGTSQPSQLSVRQTSVEALLTGMNFSTDRAFLLQPFVAAFGDLGRFEVMFLTRKIAGFAGLREWNGQGISVRLIQDGAPYRYKIVVTPEALPAGTLPVYQPEPQQQPGEPAPAQREWLMPPWLLGTAFMSGGAVFVIMLVRARLRAAGRNRQFTAEKGGVGDHA